MIAQPFCRLLFKLLTDHWPGLVALKERGSLGCAQWQPGDKRQAHC
jgi:hypothetical protein